LHVRVDDLPWLWADTSDSNTVDIGGMPPGEHKVTIELVASLSPRQPKIKPARPKVSIGPPIF